MKKIIFHIGNHKTGSSTLQKFIFKNSKLFEKFNYIYPKKFIREGDYGHSNLASELTKNKNFRRQFGDHLNFINFLKKNKKNIIISSEDLEFLDFNKNLFSKIKKTIKSKNYKIYILFFYRKPISLYISMIKEIVKSGYFFEKYDHKKNLELINKNGYFLYSKYKYWFCYKKQIKKISEVFDLKEKFIFKINYEKNNSIKNFINFILNKKDKIKFNKQKIILPKNINAQESMSKIQVINNKNKLKFYLKQFNLYQISRCLLLVIFYYIFSKFMILENKAILGTNDYNFLKKINFDINKI